MDYFGIEAVLQLNFCPKQNLVYEALIMVQETSATRSSTINTCMVRINVWICLREGKLLKFQILEHLQMDTGKFKYSPKVLAKLVLAEPFQWVQVHM